MHTESGERKSERERRRDKSVVKVRKKNDESKRAREKMQSEKAPCEANAAAGYVKPEALVGWTLV